MRKAIEVHHGRVFQVIGDVQAVDCPLTLEQAIEHALSKEEKT